MWFVDVYSFLSGSRNESGYITLSEMNAYAEMFDMPLEDVSASVRILRRVDYDVVAAGKKEAGNK